MASKVSTMSKFENSGPSLERAAVTIVLFATLTGCTSMPDYAQYDDAVDYYAQTDRYDTVSFSINASARTAITADGLADQLTSYLTQYGIQTVSDAGDAQAHIELTLSDTNRGWSHGTETGGAFALGDRHRYPASIHARVIVGGTAISDVELYYNAWSPKRDVREQQIASFIADDLLLIWHPQSSAAWLNKKSSELAPFSLVQNDVDAQDDTGQTRLSWETFPSERMLRGAGLLIADISDVSYEVRIQHIQLKEFAFSTIPVYSQPETYLQGGINEPHFVVPFVMPSCDNMIWSVRAHFTLNGRPRLTEWAGSYYTSFGMSAMDELSKSTLPPHIYRRPQATKAWSIFAGNESLMHHSRIGIVSKVVPPNGIECKELDWGVLYSDTKRAQGDFGGQIHALTPGEAVGASAVVHRQCSTDKCEFETGPEDVTDELVSCLSREFDRRSMDTPVFGVSDDETSPQNVRYILDSKINLVESKTVHGGDSNVIGTVWNKNTVYSATFETNVIDTAIGEIVGEINSAHQGSKGHVAGFFLILPIMYFPYGSVSEIRKKACDELARYTSFVLRGGVSKAWPDQYFKTESDALW